MQLKHMFNLITDSIFLIKEHIITLCISYHWIILLFENYSNTRVFLPLKTRFITRKQDRLKRNFRNLNLIVRSNGKTRHGKHYGSLAKDKIRWQKINPAAERKKWVLRGKNQNACRQPLQMSTRRFAGQPRNIFIYINEFCNYSPRNNNLECINAFVSTKSALSDTTEATFAPRSLMLSPSVVGTAILPPACHVNFRQVYQVTFDVMHCPNRPWLLNSKICCRKWVLPNLGTNL